MLTISSLPSSQRELLFLGFIPNERKYLFTLDLNISFSASLSINRGLFNIGIAHGIRKNCSFIKANTLVGISYVWSLMGHATEAGFTMKETPIYCGDIP